MQKDVIRKALREVNENLEPNKESLRAWLDCQPSRGFQLATIFNAKFGVICPERLNFVGLSFVAEYKSGGAGLHITIENGALDYIKRFGNAEALNGKKCWVFEEGPGMNTVHFICLEGDEYKDD